MLYRRVIVAVYLCFVAYDCVTCCEDRCYKPEGTEILTGSGEDLSEDDLITIGVCYSSCASNIQTYQIADFSVVNASSLDCNQKRQLNGCITGCNSTAKNFSNCQDLCLICQATDTQGCNSCDYEACMIGCNAITNTSRTGIDIDNINVILTPVPGQLYVYKASIRSVDEDDILVPNLSAASSSDVSSFIIRVSALETNATTYSLLHDPVTDVVDLMHSTHHCSLVNVSVAVVDSDGVSEYSPATEMCINAIYPQAATNFKGCFGERLVINSSEHWIINLKWELPEDTTYLQGLELNVTSTTSRRRCRSNPRSLMLKKDQTSYTLGEQEAIAKGCNYQIILTSLPKYNGSSSVVRNQLADIPSRICPSILPHHDTVLTRQLNINGMSNFTMDLVLEGDPAALQALQRIFIQVLNYDSFGTPINHFPEILLPTSNATLVNDYGSECFIDKRRRYTCSGNCNALQYSGSQLDSCIEECERARHYSIQSSDVYPNNENITLWLNFAYGPEYQDRCLFLNRVQYNSRDARCYLPTVPRNLNYTYETQHNISNVVFVNVTWDTPEITYGGVSNYVVEYINNDSKVSVIRDTISKNTVMRTIFESRYIRVSVENGCGFSNWTDTVFVNLTALFPPRSAPTEEDPPYHRYYIATGVIVGCMVFTAVVLAIIVICCCYVCKGNEETIKIDESSVIGTPLRNANRASYIADANDGGLPIDLWEISPDNVVMDESTFFGCGNFGEVYKGYLKTAAKSPTESYPAGKTVAVKILQQGAGGELKHDFLQEIALMKKVAQGCNPFVVNMIGCCTIEEPLALIMEFVSGGNLLDFLKSHRRKQVQSNNFGKGPAPYLEPSNEYSHLKSQQQHEDEQRKPLNIADLLTFAYQIACGMEYLAGKGIVHRDLACRNVLVGDQNNMKIIDFGLSKHLYDDPVYVKNQDGKLPIRWMSVEAILERKYSVQSDVWSFGIVIWELISFGDFPYPTLTNTEVINALLKGYRLECPNNCMCPPELFALAERCWYADPDLRPSFNTLATEISHMIPDYDPNQYVEIARYSPYCQMYSDGNTLEKKDSENHSDSTQNDS